MLDAALYGTVYLYFVLSITLVSLFVYLNASTGASIFSSYNKLMLWASALFVILFLGTRPISGRYFVDMSTYAYMFEQTVITGYHVRPDWAFAWLMEFSARFFSVEFFFLLCTTLYIIPNILAFSRIHNNWAFAVFLAVLGGLQTYPYIVNGIRNGMATSLVLLAFSFCNRKVMMALIMAVAFGMHKSTLIPIIGFILASIYSRPIAYGFMWLSAFIISAVGGAGLTKTLGTFISFGEDERLSTYTQIQLFSMGKAGFRLDFIAYSIVPIIISYFLATKKVKEDNFYQKILCTYLFANAVWLLVIYSEFSNRFAYLSWFMLPWVIIYPFLPQKNSTAQTPSKYLGPAILAHFSFTYYMYVFYSDGW
jgi:hypothetical protein